MISMIVAHGLNFEIGADNKLLWNCPADMQHFKKITTGKVVVMGKSTYDSIGRPLPDRTNVVLSASTKKIKGCIVCKSVNEVLDKYNDFVVIGGSKIYNEFYQYTDRLYVSIIPAYYDHADTFFIKEYKNDFSLQDSVFKDGITYQTLQRIK